MKEYNSGFPAGPPSGPEVTSDLSHCESEVARLKQLADRAVTLPLKNQYNRKIESLRRAAEVQATSKSKTNDTPAFPLRFPDYTMPIPQVSNNEKESATTMLKVSAVKIDTPQSQVQLPPPPPRILISGKDKPIPAKTARRLRITMCLLVIAMLFSPIPIVHGLASDRHTSNFLEIFELILIVISSVVLWQSTQAKIRSAQVWAGLTAVFCIISAITEPGELLIILYWLPSLFLAVVANSRLQGRRISDGASDGLNLKAPSSQQTVRLSRPQQTRKSWGPRSIAAAIVRLFRRSDAATYRIGG